MANPLGNVIWLTSNHGLASEEMSPELIQELMAAVNKVKREHKGKDPYQFIITFDDGHVVYADDIWIRIGAEIGDY